MNPANEDELLREVLDDDDVQQLRETSLAQGLSAIRGRRRAGAPRGVLVAGITLTLIVTFTWLHPRVKESPVAAVSVGYPSSNPRGVELIDDAQLLALFSNRDVALIGTPGNQKLLFLDNVPTQVAGLKNR